MTDPRYKTDYSLSRLIRYNGKRQRFFDGLHRIVLFTNAVLGSSAFVTIVSNQTHIAAWLTAVVAIASALDNVVGFSERARIYQQQRSRYYDLYCLLVSTHPDDFFEDVFREKRLRIDRDGPPPLRVLDVIARNEEDISRGYNRAETIYISSLKYLLRNIVDLPPKNWMTIADWEARPRKLTWLWRRMPTKIISSE